MALMRKRIHILSHNLPYIKNIVSYCISLLYFGRSLRYHVFYHHFI